MTRELLLSAGLVLLVAACGEKKPAHYTYAKSVDCFRDVGKTQLVGRGQNTARVAVDDSKIFELLFLPSGSQAAAYTKQFHPPNGMLDTKGNVIIYGHRTGSSVGPDVSADEMSEVEDCLA